MSACTEPDIRPRDVGPADVGADGGGFDAFVPLPDNGCSPGPPPLPSMGPDGPCATANLLPSRPRDCPPDLPNVAPIALAMVGPRFEPPSRFVFDLDGTCSTELNGRPYSCEPADPMNGGRVDLENGGDNVFASYIPYFNAAAAEVSAEREISESIQRGKLTPLLLITNWNGGRFDDQVTVTFALSVGILGVDVDPITLNPVREFAISDTLVPAADFYTSAGEPLYAIDSAYVVDGRLVARLQNVLPFRLDTREVRITIDMGAVLITGSLVDTPEYGVLLENVTIGGRWAVTSALAGLDGVFQCVDPATRVVVEELIANAADIALDPSEDNMGFPCSAFSMQMVFERTVPIAIGPPTELVNRPALCEGI